MFLKQVIRIFWDGNKEQILYAKRGGGWEYIDYYEITSIIHPPPPTSTRIRKTWERREWFLESPHLSTTLQYQHRNGGTETLAETHLHFIVSRSDCEKYKAEEPVRNRSLFYSGKSDEENAAICWKFEGKYLSSLHFITIVWNRNCSIYA